ncbi:hypothetical protein [Actinophytocola sediminis]
MSRLKNLIRHRELRASPDRLVVHLAELHSPDREHEEQAFACTGCDHTGNPMHAASWPCRTWSLLDEEVDR